MSECCLLGLCGSGYDASEHALLSISVVCSLGIERGAFGVGLCFVLILESCCVDGCWILYLLFAVIGNACEKRTGIFISFL